MAAIEIFCAAVEPAPGEVVTVADHQRHLRSPRSLKRHPAVLEEQARRAASLQLRIADGITAFAGSMPFVYLHIAVFAVWMVFLESRPWPTLTLIVSLEAIFLSTFVLISQNLFGKEAERLTDLGLQTSLLAEHELTRVLQMLRAIQHKIGISNDDDRNLADADLEMETRPEDVLAEIERLQRREASVTQKLFKLG